MKTWVKCVVTFFAWSCTKIYHWKITIFHNHNHRCERLGFLCQNMSRASNRTGTGELANDHIYKDLNLIWVKKSWRWYQFWFWMIAATRDNRTRRLRSWRWDGQVVEEVDYSKARGTKISTSSTTTAAGRRPAKQQLGEMLKIPK